MSDETAVITDNSGTSSVASEGSTSEPATSAGETTEPTTQPVEPPQDMELVKRLGSIARREKQVADQREKLKADLANASKYSDIVAKAKEDPAAVLEALGINPEQVAQAMLSRSSRNPELEALKAELESLKGGLSAREKAEQEAREQAAKQQYETFDKACYEAVSAKDSKWDLVEMKFGSKVGEEVRAFIDHVYQHGIPKDGIKAGTVVKPEHVLDTIQQVLEQQYGERLRTKFGAVKATPEAAKHTEPALDPDDPIDRLIAAKRAEKKPRLRTTVIGNSDAANVRRASKPQTDADRRAEAIKLVRQLSDDDD